MMQDNSIFILREVGTANQRLVRIYELFYEMSQDVKRLQDSLGAVERTCAGLETLLSSEERAS